jgi:phosphatidylinositol alpha-1,6-mannosyltransferase
VISVSSHTARLFQQWSHVPDEKIALLPNCVDLSAFAPAPRNPELAARYGLEASRVIMTVGRLDARERYKGFDEVLEIMPDLIGRYPDLKYLIVGTGSDLERLRAKAADLGLSERVIFAGRIPEEDKAAHYNLADVYVMPGRGEGFGIVYLEAAACGVPVIGSTLDGSRDALLDGRLGILVNPREPGEILQALELFLNFPPERHRKHELLFFTKEKFKLRVGTVFSRI